MFTIALLISSRVGMPSVPPGGASGSPRSPLSTGSGELVERLGSGVWSEGVDPGSVVGVELGLLGLSKGELEESLERGVGSTPGSPSP